MDPGIWKNHASPSINVCGYQGADGTLTYMHNVYNCDNVILNIRQFSQKEIEIDHTNKKNYTCVLFTVIACSGQFYKETC